MPHSRTLPTPSFPSPQKSTTFYGAATIAAAAHITWSTVLDLRSYSQWTPLLPSLTSEATLEENRTTLHITTSKSGPRAKRTKDEERNPPKRGCLFKVPCPDSFDVTVSRVDEVNHTLSWRCLPSLFLLRQHQSLFHAEWVIQLQDFEDGIVELRSYITAGGALRKMVFWWWGWNGHGGSGAEGMDGAMRMFCEAAGDEIGRRIVLHQDREGQDARPNERATNAIFQKEQKEERVLVNPPRREGQSWVG